MNRNKKCLVSSIGKRTYKEAFDDSCVEYERYGQAITADFFVRNYGHNYHSY